MTAVRQVHSVLIVTASKRDYSFMCTMLPPSLFKPIELAESADEARRLTLHRDFDLILIDSPLPDDFGYSFAADLSRDSQAGILLLVRADMLDSVSTKVERFGVLTVGKPVTRELFYQTVKLATATRERFRSLEQKNRRLQDKLEEAKAVNRAKWLLIEKQGMTEPQAHKHLEKMAMDARISLKKAAENVMGLA